MPIRRLVIRNERTTIAYRGYLITRLLAEGYAVSKDGHHICYASDRADAQRKVDQLLD